MSNDNAVATRRIGIAPELAAGYAGQVSINTAARLVGRIELKNKIISLSERTRLRTMSSTKIKVIGIAGPAHCGKDTAADYLLAHLPHGFNKASFADPIKQMATGLGLTHEQLYGDLKDVVDDTFGCTPRKILQTLGTEWGRERIHPDIWVRAMSLKLQNLPDGGLVMPDVRFENEANFVRQNGVLIHITGRFDNNDSPVEAHISESGLPIRDGDIPVCNNSDLEALYLRLDIALRYANAD